MVSSSGCSSCWQGFRRKSCAVVHKSSCEEPSLTPARSSTLLMPTIRSDSSLSEYVAYALHPNVRLDHPLITRICELVERNPHDVKGAVSLLVATLGVQTLKEGDERKITQDYFKSLAVLNEMIYIGQVKDVLQQMPLWRAFLQRLMLFQGGELGKDADAVIRMLATELNVRTSTPDQACVLCNSLHGAGAGVVAQASVLGVTYCWYGYPGMVGLVYVATGGTAIVPVTVGFAATAGIGALAGALTARRSKYLIECCTARTRGVR